MDNPEAQQLPTSGIVESRLGQIELTNGYPTDATARRVFDEIDFQFLLRLLGFGFRNWRISMCSSMLLTEPPSAGATAAQIRKEAMTLALTIIKAQNGHCIQSGAGA